MGATSAEFGSGSACGTRSRRASGRGEKRVRLLVSAFTALAMALFGAHEAVALGPSDLPSFVDERFAAPVAAQAAPTVKTEYPVADLSGVAGDDSGPSIAFDGTNYLVVWSTSGGSDNEILGARVSPAGNVLDGGGMLISNRADGSSKAEPVVAFDGTNYLVAWAGWATNSQVRGARVSPAGVVLDPDGISIATDHGADVPAVACGGGTCLVTWYDGRNEQEDIYGARVSGAGAVLDPGGIPISVAPGYPGSPDVAFTGSEFFVVWDDGRAATGRNVYGARVTTGGNVLDPSGIAISNSGAAYTPAIATNGTNSLVVWHDQRSGLGSDIYGARIGTSGTALDPGGIPISTAADYQDSARASFDGSNYIVTWTDQRSGNAADIYGARISPAGANLNPAGAVISNAPGLQDLPVVAFDGTNSFAVWVDARPSPTATDIFGTRLSTGLAALDPAGRLISTSPSTSDTSVAFDGTNYFVVWTDSRMDGKTEIYGARVSPSGTMLDGTGIPISPGAGAPSASYAELPKVSFDGTNYLVVWQEYANNSMNIYGARVSKTGTVLSPGRFVISQAADHQTRPDVAFNGTDYLVVWEDRRSTTNLDIYGARVSPAGAVLGLAIVSTAAGDQTAPRVAAGGSQWLVVWSDHRSGATDDIYSSLVSATGGTVTKSGVPISTASGNQSTPAVAWNATRYLVVWNDRRSGTTSDIYGSRVTSTNAVQDTSGVAITTAGGDQSVPTTSANGAEFLVAWIDRRSGTNADIYSTRLNDSGTVLDGTSGFAVSAQPGDEKSPALSVSHPAGGWGVVYTRPLPGQPNFVPGRAFLRTVAPK